MIISTERFFPCRMRVALSRCSAPDTIREASATTSHAHRSLSLRIDRLGGFEGDIDADITAHVWVGSKAPWFDIEDALPCYPEAMR